MPATKSRYSRPSRSQTRVPSPRTSVIGRRLLVGRKYCFSSSIQFSFSVMRWLSPACFLRLRARVRARHDHRSEEHTSELQSPDQLVCRLLLEKKIPQPLPGLLIIVWHCPVVRTTG